jgi:hypothetical protein
MEKTFHFQSHLRYSEGPVTWFFTALIVGCLALPLVVQVPPLLRPSPLIRLSWYASGTLFCAVLLSRIFLRRWRFARFVVADHHLVQYGLFSVKAVSFAEVKRVRHFHFWYWMGVMAISSEKTTIMLPFIVSDLSGLARLIGDKLREHGRGDVYDGRKHEAFIRAASVNDVVNERIYSDFRPLMGLVMLCGWGGLFVAQNMWYLHVTLAMLWAFFSFAAPMIGYLAANALLALRVAGYVKREAGALPAFDPSRLYAKVGLVTGLLYLTAGIAFRTFCYWLL